MDHLTQFATDVAQSAGRLPMDHYGHMQSLEYKLKTNFKTRVDDLSDQLIRETIIRRFPSHSIYSEEQDTRLRGSEFIWVVDPLDGTVPYSYGTSDHFAVSIALLRDSRPLLGVICAPLRKELYVAERGRGATCNNRPLRVNPVHDLNRALLASDCGKLDRKALLPYKARLPARTG